MRILITGGFGYVGGRLALHLNQSGHKIFLGTRKNYVSPVWLPEASVVQIDWVSDKSIDKACQGMDAVIHCAGINAKNCAGNPVQALEFNGLATSRLAHSSSNSNVKRFLYLSTAHVYSDPLAGNISEDTCPRNLHPYATSHLSGESAVLQISNTGKMHSTILRLSNAFGKPASISADCWMLLVNDLCRQAVVERSLTLKSNGEQLRDFISLTNVCQLIENILSYSPKLNLPPVLNIGSGYSQSVLEMTEKVQNHCHRILGYKPEIIKPLKNNSNKLPFKFICKGLKKINLAIEENSEQEIDELLHFCATNF